MKTTSNYAREAMKKYMFALTAVVAALLIGCKESPYINAPGDNSKVSETIPVLKADTSGTIVTVEEAVAICNAMSKDGETTEYYKMTGVITNIKTDLSKVPTPYSNIDFEIADIGGKKSITCFRCNYLNNYPFKKASDMPGVGSKVTVRGTLCNYGGTTPEVKNCFIMRIDEAK